MYSVESRIRYSEVDVDEKLPLDGIINYFQDCSTFHSEDVGVGLDYLIEHHRAWVLSSWQIIVDRYPKFGEHISVGTWAYAFQGFIGSRNFIMRDESGQQIACANSIWVYLNTETEKPAKLDEFERKAYELEPKLDMEYASRKIRLPESYEMLRPITILEHHLDTNHHVNNGQYVKMALGLLPEHQNIHQLRVEYRKPAKLGDIMGSRLYTEESRQIIALCDGQGELYSVVEFS